MYVRGVIRPRKGSSKTTVNGVVSTSPGVTDIGAPVVTAHIHVDDTPLSRSVLCLLAMSLNEARALAKALVRDANEAEMLAASTPTQVRSRIPENFPVQPLNADEHPKGKTTCGTCGLSWDDDKPTSLTPTPSARCPFEYFHTP